MKKKLLASLLSLTMAATIVATPLGESISNNLMNTSISASAEDATLTYGDYKYKILKDETVEIARYNGSETNVIIPSTIEGKKVTSIGDDAFFNNLTVININIPDGVTNLGDYSFNHCENLESIDIPNSVREIGVGAFALSAKIKNIIIPNGVETLSSYLFSCCDNLANIQLPNSLKDIQNHVFKSCSKLKSISIPTSVTSIDVSAFAGCSALESVVIPNGVITVEDAMFYGCSSLKKVSLPNSIRNINGGAFYGCSSLKNITIPSSVTTLGVGVFTNCTNLKEITIPKSVKNVGWYAFGYKYYRGAYIKRNDFKIKCYHNTAGEKYAKENKFTPIYLDKHSYKNVTVKSTYFAKGYTGQKCSKCGTISNKKYSAMLKMSAPKASVTTSSAKLYWSKISGAKGYNVYQAKNGKWVKIKTVTGTSYTVSKLKAGTSYKFCVKPYTKSGSKTVYGYASNVLSTSTKPATANFKLYAGRKKATVKWSKVAGASGYKIYYKTSSKGKWRGLKTVNSKTTSYTKTRLSSKKTYWFTVKAYKNYYGKTYNAGYYTKSVRVK